MTLDEFERLLSGAQENSALEFKGQMEWNKHQIVKDILAMANSVDGGRIIFGIEDETLKRQGLTPEQLSTYDPETIMDQIAPYADPEVVMTVSTVTDGEEKTYVVIGVSPFTLHPVICKKDGQDVSAGRIYIRPRGGRPQSREIKASSELRDLVDRSIGANISRYRELGIIGAPEIANGEEVPPEFDQEIGDLR